MSIEDAKKLISDLRGRFAFPYNQSDREKIAKLYWEVLGKVFRPTHCQNCYHDAVIEIYGYLKRHDIMAEQKQYVLRAGAIINCPKFDDGKIYSNHNLTDDVARRYLEMFPGQTVLFQRMPEEQAETDVQSKEEIEVDKLPTEKGNAAREQNKTAKRKKR